MELPNVAVIRPNKRTRSTDVQSVGQTNENGCRKKTPRLLEFIVCVACATHDRTFDSRRHEECQECRRSSKEYMLTRIATASPLVLQQKADDNRPKFSSSSTPDVPITNYRVQHVLGPRSVNIEGGSKNNPVDLIAPQWNVGDSGLISEIMITAGHKPKRPALVCSSMGVSEVIEQLEAHGCPNISSDVNEGACTPFPVSGGGLGDVYRGTLSNGSIVAVKTIRLRFDSTITGEKNLKHTARELYTWSKCRHPNILELHGLVVFRGQIGMVSPWAEKGDLMKYLAQEPGVDRCQLSTQVCHGLEYLHGIGVVHGDLKGANILVSDDGTPMLIDFGNSVMKERTLLFSPTSSNLCISLRWTAPEIMSEGSSFSMAGDIYALGMTILEILTGNVPYAHKREHAVMYAVSVSRELPIRPEDEIPTGNAHGDRLWDLLLECWSYDPEQRPAVSSVTCIMGTILRDDLSGLRPL